MACPDGGCPFSQYANSGQSRRFELRTRGRVLQFDGFTRVQPQQLKKTKISNCRIFVRGDACVEGAGSNAALHQAPARFTEASLVGGDGKTRGIGRPYLRQYYFHDSGAGLCTKLANRRFYAEKMGDIVTERLVESFSDL